MASTSSLPTSPPSPPAPQARPVPPLQDGDRLTRDEFERRYEAMPHVKKAELIAGVVYMPSPVRIDKHAEKHGWVIFWLTGYCAYTPGVRIADNGTTRLNETDEPQPDGLLFVDGPCGGQAHIDSDDYLAGAPELAAEISASSVSTDLGPKMEQYRISGVSEYFVWRVLDRAIDWYVLRNNQYEPLAADAHGIIRSEVFPGLRLDTAALLAGELLRVSEELVQGTATAEHAAFVARLQQNAKPE